MSTEAALLVLRVEEQQQPERGMAVGVRVEEAAPRVLRGGEALDVLHRAGLKRCEPEAGDVIVELGDNPVFVNLIGAQPAEGGVPDTVWLARLLIDWLTAGRGAPPQRPWDILRGRVPYNPLAGAKVEGKMPEGLIRLLKAVLRNREGAPKTPGAFASRLQAFA